MARPTRRCSPISCAASPADRERIDEAISAALSDEWPMSRLETLLRLIIEAGAYELMHRADIPPRVTISEYVAIAYAFFTGKRAGPRQRRPRPPRPRPARATVRVPCPCGFEMPGAMLARVS